jgi:ER membrane protein complex subunit 7
LDVYSSVYHFPQLKVKVSAENASVSAVEYKYPGAPRQPAVYPLQIQAIVPMIYTIPKPPFSLLGMLLGNPMMLLMLFTGLMAFAMPKVL